MEQQAIAITNSKYVRDFEALFIPIKKTELRDKARNGLLRDSLFRSICWRYFLHCLPEQYDRWLESCEQSRAKYEEIRAKHLAGKQLESDNQSSSIGVVKSPSTDVVGEVKKDEEDSSASSVKEDEVKSGSSCKELEDEQQFIKATNQCDHKNVFRTIERDVVRTFPDMEFFRQTEMQNILENVLYNFASENPHLSYKQGMHELLAILLYVLHTDSQTCLITYEGGYANDSIATLLDRKYLEHDVFHLFCALMKSIETWYQNDEILITTAPQVPVKATDALNNKQQNSDLARRSNNTSRGPVSSVLGIKLNMISENIVKNYDLELFNHLEALQIAPQIYGIRWMRLLFGREFEFLDLLTVWDAIICDTVSMSLTEYIFASMLVTIREELVNGDYTDCLNNLMRHQFKDVQYVIKLALHLRDPQNYTRPKAIQSLKGAQKHYKQSAHQQQHNSRFSSETSLTSKLSQQYISGSKNQLHQKVNNRNNFSSQQSVETARQYLPKMTNSSNTDNRDSRRIFMTPKPQPNEQRPSQLDHRNGGGSFNVGTASGGGGVGSGIRFLSSSANRAPGPIASSTNKFLPNINKFVSSIGQNIQDKTNQSQSASSISSSRAKPQSSSQAAAAAALAAQNQQYHHRSNAEQTLVKMNPVKEYEMREMLSTSSGSMQRGQMARFPIGTISDSKNALNLSTESYDDLHSIVDYCWRLLSEQIDSLQRCLPKEKSLHSEDEIFVALAQLKKVRDVLKGSLRLEDELDSPPGNSKS